VEHRHNQPIGERDGDPQMDPAAKADVVVSPRGVEKRLLLERFHDYLDERRQVGQGDALAAPELLARALAPAHQPGYVDLYHGPGRWHCLVRARQVLGNHAAHRGEGQPLVRRRHRQDTR
jgi:hypothetical protein